MSVSVRLCAGARCISLGGLGGAFQCQILLSWQGDLSIFSIQDPPRGEKKLEETVGSHHNFVPLEALPIPMLSDYHRIISDNQLYDFTIKTMDSATTWQKSIHSQPPQKWHPFGHIFQMSPTKDHSKGPWHRRRGVVCSVDGTLDAVRNELHETFTWETAVRQR